MGKSTHSCLKILACGSRSVEHDDVQSADGKSSIDRRGWSFRKRSARHRVLTDNAGQEVAHTVNKENQGAKEASFQVETGLDVAEKTPVVQLIEEKNVPPTERSTKLSDIIGANEDSCEEDQIFDEASVIVIQAFIRGFLARRVFLKEKNVLKLQAAARGHLVRRQAVGALRCVLAIIRIQARVRAQRGRLAKDGSDDSSKKARKEAESDNGYTCASIEKLLSNSFANKLMESTSRAKSVSLKCDSNSDSWKWLEIWTSVSTVTEEHHESGSATTENAAENPVDSDTNDDNVAAPGNLSESTEVKPEFVESADTSEDESNAIVYDANGFSLPQPENESPLSHVPEAKSSPTEVIETDSSTTEPLKSLSKEESGSETTEAEPKTPPTEQSNTEMKRFSRKASNPAFIAAQSKFEDLTSATTPMMSTSFSSYDHYSSATDQSIKSRDKILADGASSAASALGAGVGSECGTELSISSTLDSSDGSEFGTIEIRPETGVPYDTNHVVSQEEQDPSSVNSKKLEEPIVKVASPVHENTSIANQKLSPENSPRSLMSQITAPESQATPSSDVSVKPKKKNDGEKSESHAKVRPPISEKKSYSNINPDSASRNSMEHSQEHKAKGPRNSFGSAKTDHKDQDYRDNTSSSNSIPGYMQPTESAKAKVIANGSPRSSPDVQDKETYIRKRHSLPVSNERHGSPRIQRSLSQTPENGKGSNTQSPQDRKWRR